MSESRKSRFGSENRSILSKLCIFNEMKPVKSVTFDRNFGKCLRPSSAFDFNSVLGVYFSVFERKVMYWRASQGQRSPRVETEKLCAVAERRLGNTAIDNPSRDRTIGRECLKKKSILMSTTRMTSRHRPPLSKNVFINDVQPISSYREDGGVEATGFPGKPANV